MQSVGPDQAGFSSTRLQAHQQRAAGPCVAWPARHLPPLAYQALVD